jgi:hypothetical protein
MKETQRQTHFEEDAQDESNHQDLLEGMHAVTLPLAVVELLQCGCSFCLDVYLARLELAQPLCDPCDLAFA